MALVNELIWLVSAQERWLVCGWYGGRYGGWYVVNTTDVNKIMTLWTGG